MLSSWRGGYLRRPPREGFAAPAFEVMEGAQVLLRPRGDSMSEAIAFSVAISESIPEFVLAGGLERSGAISEFPVSEGTWGREATSRGRGAASRNKLHPSLSPERRDGDAGVRGVAGRATVWVRRGGPGINSSWSLAFSFSHAKRFEPEAEAGNVRCAVGGKFATPDCPLSLALLALDSFNAYCAPAVAVHSLSG